MVTIGLALILLYCNYECALNRRVLACWCYERKARMENCAPRIITPYTRKKGLHLMKRLNSQLQKDGAPLELILLIRTLLAGCKEISFRVSQGALAGVLGSTLSENVQGETQKKLDVISNHILKDSCA